MRKRYAKTAERLLQTEMMQQEHKQIHALVPARGAVDYHNWRYLLVFALPSAGRKCSANGVEIEAKNDKFHQFSTTGLAWADFGRPLEARKRKKADFSLQDASQDGPRRPKGRPQDAQRATKEAPRRVKWRRRGSQRSFWEHFGVKNNSKTAFLLSL